MKQRLAQLALPASLNYLHAAVEFIRSLADTVGLQKDEIDDLHLAFEEVMVNIIRHGLEENPDDSVELECLRLPTGLQVTLRDKGNPFDPDLMPQYSPQAPDENTMDSLGAYLAEKVLDELEYHHLGRHGNLTILVKHGRAYRIDATNPELTQETSSPKELKPVPDNITIRPLRTNEAVEVSRTAYRTYGYTYEPFIYFPDRVVHMNRTGKLDSLVAVDNDGVILGHIALKHPFSSAHIAEMGVTFVNPDYESAPILNMLAKAALELAENQDLRGVYAKLPCQTSYSMSGLLKHGFHTTALLAGLFPVDSKSPEISRPITRKSGGILLYKPLVTKRIRLLFPPWDHTRRLQKIYDESGISFKFQAPDAQFNPDPWSDTVVRSVTTPFFNIADMYIEKVGANWEQTIRVHWRHLLLEKKDAIYIHLDLENPATPFICKRCEDWGFVFAGILPNANNGHDALVLQYINNVQLEMCHLNTDDAVAQSLFNDLKENETIRELGA